VQAGSVACYWGVVEPLEPLLTLPDDRVDRLLWCFMVDDVPPVDMPDDESVELDPIEPEPLEPIEPEPIEPAPVEPIAPEPVKPVPAEPLGLICAMAVVPTSVAAAAIAINIFTEILFWID
jgi:hypothetical protein